MINTVCDKSVTHNKPFHIILSILRGYQVTIIYCDVSRYCIQYKKSGTFKLVPQSSYLSEQYTCIDLKHSQNLQSSLQFHHIFYYSSIYLASTYIRKHHLNLLAFGIYSQSWFCIPGSSG